MAASETLLRREPWGLLYFAFSWLRRGHCATMLTGPCIHIILESEHSLFDLCAQVCAMETSFMDYIPTILAVPPQAVERLFWPWLFEHHSYRIRESDWIMRCIRGQQVQ